MTPLLLVARSFALVSFACVVLLLLTGEPAMPFEFVMTEEFRELLSIAGSVAFAAIMLGGLIFLSTFGLKGKN